jgi:DNA recombination protein RmuC
MIMDISSIFLVVLIVVVIFGLLFIIRKLGSFKKDNSQDQSMILLQKQISELTKEINIRLSEQNKTFLEQMRDSNKTIQSQFAISSRNLQAINEASSKVVKEVTEKLTKLDDTNKQVVSFADQLQSLENILKNPKQRGILGEYFLETLLGNILPPIDAKFSLEAYNKLQKEKDKEKRSKYIKQFKMDLKKRIDETSKYIRPEYKTTDFAFMFIPAEGLYYNLLVYRVGGEVSSQDLIEYAFSKKVSIVSPNSFFAFLQTVLQALKTLQVQESVQEIIKNVIVLQKHLKVYDENMQKLGKHIGTTVNTYNSSYKEFKKIDKDVTKISGKKGAIDPIFLDQPKEVD